VHPTPVWLMRQAGRYLPEYRELRKRARNFLEFCYAPALAVEATLQPLRRYSFDAAILFSDILVVPDALGQEVRFVENEGPRLGPIPERLNAGNWDAARFGQKLAPVYETVERLKKALPADKALIGFAGAPWTVATYMIAGRGGTDLTDVRRYAWTETEKFGALIDLLVEATIAHLSAQIEAGAEAVQIFDSWAGALAEPGFRAWCIAPTKTIVERLKARFPGVPIIGFPRGAGVLLAAYAVDTGVDAVSLDTTVPGAWAASAVQARGICVQGNLDPAVLIAGGDALDREVDRLKATFAGGPWVFNLGHGIQPETPPEHVTRLVTRLKVA